MRRKKKVVTVKVDEVMFEELERYAKLVGVSRSELVRRAIDHYIRTHLRPHFEHRSVKVVGPI